MRTCFNALSRQSDFDRLMAGLVEAIIDCFNAPSRQNDFYHATANAVGTAPSGFNALSRQSDFYRLQQEAGSHFRHVFQRALAPERFLPSATRSRKPLPA